MARQLLERSRAELGLDEVAPVGEGLLGWVFVATQPSLGRRVAVKVGKLAARELAGDPVWQQARAMAQLDHPGVVRVYGAGRLGEDGPGYALLEWVAGHILEQWLARTTASPARGKRVLTLVTQLAQVLVHGHERGVVHGDVKAANVLVPDDVRRPAVLVDWSGHAIADPDDASGSSRLVIASADGMPPERFQRESADAEPGDDLWALAATARAALAEQIPAALAPLLARALAPDPAVRLRSARELLAGLRRARGPATDAAIEEAD